MHPNLSECTSVTNFGARELQNVANGLPRGMRESARRLVGSFSWELKNLGGGSGVPRYKVLLTV